MQTPIDEWITTITNRGEMTTIHGVGSWSSTVALTEIHYTAVYIHVQL